MPYGPPSLFQIFGVRGVNSRAVKQYVTPPPPSYILWRSVVHVTFGARLKASHNSKNIYIICCIYASFVAFYDTDVSSFIVKICVSRIDLFFFLIFSLYRYIPLYLSRDLFRRQACGRTRGGRYFYLGLVLETVIVFTHENICHGVNLALHG